MSAPTSESGNQDEGPDSNATGSPLTVDRRSGLAIREFQNDYLAKNRPVVITDAVTGWPAVKDWTPMMFAKRFPKKEITLRDHTKLTMDVFIRQVMESSAANPAPYWTNAPLAEHFPELLGDINPALPYFSPNWAARRYLHRGVQRTLNRGATIEIYIGGRGGAFPILHYDGSSTHAFLMQIHGVKRFWAWSPANTPYMYPIEYVPNTSPIRDVEHPDLERYPLFAKARGGTFTLSPGEMLFVPSRWWHTAKMESSSITLSINTVDRWNWPQFCGDTIHNTSGFNRLLTSAYLRFATVSNHLADIFGRS